MALVLNNSTPPKELTLLPLRPPKLNCFHSPALKTQVKSAVKRKICFEEKKKLRKSEDKENAVMMEECQHRRELECMFKKQLDEDRKRCISKYNFDPLHERPLNGFYQWKRVKGSPLKNTSPLKQRNEEEKMKSTPEKRQKSEETTTMRGCEKRLKRRSEETPTMRGCEKRRRFGGFQQWKRVKSVTPQKKGEKEN